MPITLEDLTVNFRHLNASTLLEDWEWLLGTKKLPILLAAIGNAFVQDVEDGRVHVLDVGSGELRFIAEDSESFRKLLNHREFVADEFVVQIIGDFLLEGPRLLPGQIFSFKRPPVLGGEYAAENLEPTDIEVHFSVLGQIHQQVREMPPGTPISEIKFSDGSGGDEPGPKPVRGEAHKGKTI
ncbi:MAG: DUF1851 domain-containing protein [Holophagaceae bacterium]